MAVIIGLTGGIGSGKSTIAKIFANLGVPVFDADSTAKHIMNTSSVIKEKLIAAFGDEVYIKSEIKQHSVTPIELLNRSYLSKIVFSDPFKLATLNPSPKEIPLTALIDKIYCPITACSLPNKGSPRPMGQFSMVQQMIPPKLSPFCFAASINSIILRDACSLGHRTKLASI